MERKFIMKNISALYKDICINSKGEVIQGGNRLSIYEITPINVLEKNEIVRSKIYNLYYACIKGMTDDFKILVVKDKVNYAKNIDALQKRASGVASETLRHAITTYAENLEKIFSENTATFNRYFVVAKASEDIKERFSGLEELGVGLKMLTDECEVQELFRKEVLQAVL